MYLLYIYISHIHKFVFGLIFYRGMTNQEPTSGALPWFHLAAFEGRLKFPKTCFGTIEN